MDEVLVHYRVSPSIKFAGTHFYTWMERGAVKIKCLAQEHNTICPAKARSQPLLKALNRYLIFGLGFPVAAHVNVTFPPSSAVVLAGDTVIIGGDDLDGEVVGISLSDTTAATVTGAKELADNFRIRTIIIKNIKF